MPVETIKPVPSVRPIRRIDINKREKERRRDGATDQVPRKDDGPDARINEVDDYV
ncbi:MAG: hypothetical protein ACI915_000929 [Gammaproteobacteria bacterium]|jgi:hypothetical protein